MPEETSTEKFNLVFKGELAKNFTLEQAKVNLSKLFKISGPKLDALFSGKAVTLKKNMDFETASKYRVAIKKAGGLVHLVEIKAPAQPASEPAKPAQPKAVFEAREPAAQATVGSMVSSATTSVPAAGAFTLEAMDEVSSSGAGGKARFGEQAPSAPADVESAVAVQVTQATEDYAVAPAGTPLADKQATAPAPQVDISSMTISEAGADLLQESEKSTFVPASVDTSSMDLAEPGADLLQASEKTEFVEREIDLSRLSVAEVGVRLEDPKPASPPAPDVSKIQLAD